ncbi:rod-binding protein [Treponema sp.]|uniref:rod-binding protein n=1 Tax=Treponema sp. TaxID=166 RepID=UPI00298ECA6A|nr:rod-binding protein [Treponema sp.]
MTGITGLGNLTQTNTMMNHTMQVEETNRFNALVKAAKSSSSADTNGTVSSEQISIRDTRLNGEFTSDYSGTYKSEADKAAKPSGFAANAKGQQKTIDKTSKLYEKSLELESFFVKMMVDSMRKTVTKSNQSENSFAQKMYEDMLYDEYTTVLTKNSGFGIADSIYLELSR